MSSKLSEIQKEMKKLKEGCKNDYVLEDDNGDDIELTCGFQNQGLCPTCQAKLSTWKQALTYQLKELDEDIEFFENWLKSYGLGDYKLHEDNSIKQKLAEKQSKKAEIIKLIGELK